MEDKGTLLMNNINEEEFVNDNRYDLWHDDGSDPLMKMYIGCHYPATVCNLHCPYCYVNQVGGDHKTLKLGHSPEFIRWCLSQKRIGGRALIGLCGAGETMLGDQIIEVALELLREGHFLHIVTNGTIGEKMCELTERSENMANRIFFKCSLHYTELKRKNMLLIYSNNINKVSDMGASYTIEMTADDSYIELIDEIKKYTSTEFGALPHITIARDDTKADIPILTKLPLDEYYDIWKDFESELFEVKWKYYAKHIINCDAGVSSLYINLINGDIMKCLRQTVVGNLYDISRTRINYDRVGNHCGLPYCYNNHAYLTLGVCRDIKTYSFAEVRDRKKTDGSHWVKGEVYSFMGQRLYENI